MDKNYYLEYYELERTNWWFRARQEIIRSQIVKLFGNRRDLSILNIGVATGASSIMLQEFGTVKSIEYDPDCYRFVKENVDIDIEPGSILELRFKANSYDLVCSFDVIEHVEDDKLAATEMMRVCKPDGFVFVTVPAFMSLWSHHDEVNHHCRRYRMNELKSLFISSGLIQFYSYFNFLLFLPIYLIRILSKIFPVMFKREGSGSDFGMFKSKSLDSILHKLFILEKVPLKFGIKFPFGVSALLIWKK